ncbi:hypothetical protein OQJ15_06540 [Fluoribacter dumoffii]|uniref:Coiled-coil protein n=1 Tax=Fluoribacter dumoffii TaxID=463 RepID=A0A377GAB3_9GAMM|nr:hypothetical protein [Fluoribacter dumoffii]KTC88745.1 coiled-coil protein [Fluoribacter dumoffii NY 23]MCW8385960.1 hypothetical protein [Fluoribacter dumoffii]MCW8495746.1 hypothetical protein [Fluoribacter dumoffii]STO21767.1 Uncharacterised protein [Fluoribacter dumoffii]
MELGKKNRIIRRFLKEISENPVSMELQDIDMSHYSDLDKLLEHIDLHKNNLFDWETFETDPEQWREFCAIIKFSTVFEKGGSPPLLKSVDFIKAEEGIRYTLNAHEIIQLPRDNYYERPTRTLQDVDTELEELIVNSRAKLYALTQTFADPIPFNAADSLQVLTQIQFLDEEMEKLPQNNSAREIIEKKLKLLLDLNNLNGLKRIIIPQDNGTELVYCTLQENIGGVTEKISLMSLEEVKQQLHRLCDRTEGLSAEEYIIKREHYRLSTKAIIKLPKHGNIKEVQHEAIGLNISRMFGLATAAVTTISYNGHPALFIPFDEIQLLGEFSIGKVFYAWLMGKTYTHYSTIKPLGEGIQADCFIDDFGNALGLLYLCSDTDAIGGNCQNKALKNAKSLFVFDQSLMESQKFILDSRLCLIPGEFLKRHTRHGLGRNRTLIEDSSMHSKFESIITLRDLGPKIIQYMTHILWQHQCQSARIKRQFKNQLSPEKQSQLTSELSDLMVLEKDAEILRTSVMERLAAIDDVFPQTTGDIDLPLIRSALIFEKLIHNPILFSDDGRPFKNAWTYRQPNKIKRIDCLDNNLVQLTFSDKVSSVMVDFIKRRGGGNSITLTSAKTITLDKTQLVQLREDILHPEHQFILDPFINYLDPADLAIIKDAYYAGNRTYIMHTIKSYSEKIADETNTTEDKLECIIETEEQLRELIMSANDRGFGMHVLKKFFFDAQLQLQKLISPREMPIKLNDAFSAALKLDRVAEFNAVVLEAIKQDKIRDAQFICFLDKCIKSAKAATNYTQAQQESLKLSRKAKRTIRHLEGFTMPFITKLLKASLTQNELKQTEQIIPTTKQEKEENAWPVKVSPDSLTLEMGHEEHVRMLCN